jgi:hypothetical protein
MPLSLQEALLLDTIGWSTKEEETLWKEARKLITLHAHLLRIRILKDRRGDEETPLLATLNTYEVTGKF